MPGHREPRDGGPARRLDVLIVDDHPLVRAGLRSLLEQTSDLCVVGSAEDGQQAVELAAQLQPDVVLLDVRMPGVSGLEIVGRLRDLRPAPAVVMLSSAGEQSTVRRALDAGALGFVLKDSPPDQLLDGLREVAAGRVAVDPRADGSRRSARSSG